jgi:hypothetical protein
MLEGIAGSFASIAFERLHARVNLGLRQEDLGAAAPDHDEPIELVLVLEPPDVLAQLIREIALVLPRLDVRTIEPLDVAPIEHRRPRTDRLELRPNLLEQRGLEHARRLRRLVRVVLEDVPPAEHHIVERGERHEVLDERGTRLRALAEPHGAHLRERADRLGEPAPNREHAGDRGRADGAHADEQHAELPCRRCDFSRIFHNRELYHHSSDRR